MSDQTSLELQESFLNRLSQESKLAPTGQFSMYTIGAQIGVDRDLAGRLAEELMALGWVEIRTLAGDIGITDEGRAHLAQSSPEGEKAVTALGHQPVLDDAGRAAVEAWVAELKVGLPQLGLDFDLLADLVVDIRTVEVQLTSPRARTAVIRAVLEAIANDLAGNLPGPLAGRLSQLMG